MAFSLLKKKKDIEDKPLQTSAATTTSPAQSQPASKEKPQSADDGAVHDSGAQAHPWWPRFGTPPFVEPSRQEPTTEEPMPAVNTNAARPGPTADAAAPLDDVERARQELDRIQSAPITKKNNRFVSALMAAIAKAGEMARINLQTGQNNAQGAFALAGAAGAGALGGGAIDQLYDEKQDRAREVAKAQQKYDYTLQRSDASAAIAKRRADAVETAAGPQIERDKIKAQRGVQEKRLEMEEKQRLTQQYNSLPTFDPNDPANADFLAQAKTAGVSLPPKEKGDKVNMTVLPDGRVVEQRVNAKGDSSYKYADVDGKPIVAPKPHDLKIPDTFYKGKDKDALKVSALASVLSSGKYNNAQVKPEILNAYGGDMERVNRAIRNGELSASQAFSDPQKGAAFDAEVAAAQSSSYSRAQDFDRAIDMTSRDSSAKRISYAQFERAYGQYQQDLARARSQKDKEQARTEFEKFLAGVRLVD
jgi:hypothetical protein